MGIMEKRMETIGIIGLYLLKSFTCFFVCRCNGRNAIVMSPGKTACKARRFCLGFGFRVLIILKMFLMLISCEILTEECLLFGFLTELQKHFEFGRKKIQNVVTTFSETPI